MRKMLLTGVAAVAMTMGGAAYAAFPGPGVNDNPLGPEFLITFNADGSVATTLNPVYTTDPGPYDGVEDTYFGVINNSSVAKSMFSLTSTQDIGGFDGDGIDTYGVTGNSTDTTGYGGPNAFFTNNLGTSLIVNFLTPIAANGGTDIFSLEEAISLTSPPVVGPGTPEPSTWFMMLAGFAGMGFIAYRKRGAKKILDPHSLISD
jgi:hypothetical protein